MGCSERKRELRRRRHRQVKLEQFKRKASSANMSEKGVIADKLRRLTPGSEVIIARLGLDDR